MKLLVIEDDKRIAHVLKQGLIEDGHTVFVSHRGDEGMELVASQYFDVIVLDVMLPGKDGLSIVRHARQVKCDVPILMLTARDGMPDVVRGLDSGADDYMTKPFQLEVLLARVRAMGRRGQVPLMDQITVGDLLLNRSQKIARRGNRNVPLTRKEFALLDLLMRRASQVVSRSELIEAAWGFDIDVSDNTIDFHMHSLRNKISQPGSPSPIRTVRSQGYNLSIAE